MKSLKNMPESLETVTVVVLYYKTKNPFEAKICLKISFQLL